MRPLSAHRRNPAGAPAVRRRTLCHRVLVAALTVGAAFAQNAQPQPQPQDSAAQPAAAAARDLFVTVGKSLIVESPVNIQRISIANGSLAEAVAVTPREVLVNGLAAGETSLIIWQHGGNRLLFDLRVQPGNAKLEVVRQTLARELPGEDITVRYEQGTVFLSGTVKNLVSAQRAEAIAGTLGKPVNLLHVKVPEPDEQILLKVRFANVDRSAGFELASNFYKAAPIVGPGDVVGKPFQGVSGALAGRESGFALTDALNLFLFRRDPNFGAVLRALQTKNLLQMLAEPNLLAANGKPASFLAGGEVPVPTVQSSSTAGGAGAVTIQYREFGVRINFIPRITPRGTIRLEVAPEVSSLDYANAVTLSGFTIPAISTRRVRTEIELESGQSFAIAGLLDNRLVDALSKIPGLGDIPLLGKLFQTKTTTRNNTELLVLVTPELVRPVPAGQPVPEIKMPGTFLKGGAVVQPRTPGIDATGPVPVHPPHESMPVEELMEQQKAAEPAYQGTMPGPMVLIPAAAMPASAGSAQPQTAGSNSNGASPR